MRRLLGLVLAAAVLYGGYWVVGSRAALAGARQALTELKAQGLADFADVTIRGFPSRFDLTIDQPQLMSRDGAVVWRAPFVQVFALSYRPNHLIGVWPHDQALTIAGRPLAVLSEDMRASAVVGASARAPLDHAQAVVQALTVRDTDGTGAAATELRAAIRSADPALNSYDIAVEGLGIAPTGRAADMGALIAGDPAATGWLKLDSTATFDRPLDRDATGGALRITDLAVTALRVTYGRLDIDGSGTFRIGPDRLPEGQVALAIRGWQGLPELLVRSGAIKPEVAPTVTRVLMALSLAGGDADGSIRLPLTARSGQLSLGPIPLGPAPRL